MTQKSREVMEAEIAAAEGEIACVIAAILVEIALDCRDVLNAIEVNTRQS